MNIFRFWWAAFQLKFGARDPKTESVRETLVSLLGKSGRPKAFEVLMSTLTNDVSSRVKCAAVEALGDLKDARALEPLVQSLMGERELSAALWNEIDARQASQQYAGLSQLWDAFHGSVRMRRSIYGTLDRLHWTWPDANTDISFSIDRFLCSRSKDTLGPVLDRLRGRVASASVVATICGEPDLRRIAFDNDWPVTQKETLIGILVENRDGPAIARVLNYLIEREVAAGRNPEPNYARRLKGLMILCVNGLAVTVDPQWIPILRRTMELDYWLDHARPVAVAKALLACGWKPGDSVSQVHLLVSTGNWEGILKMGAEGARILSRLRFDHDCRESTGKGIEATSKADKTLLAFGDLAVNPLIAIADELCAPEWGNTAAGPYIDLLYELGDPGAVAAMKKVSKLWRGESITRGSVDRKIEEFESRCESQPP